MTDCRELLLEWDTSITSVHVYCCIQVSPQQKSIASCNIFITCRSARPLRPIWWFFRGWGDIVQIYFNKNESQRGFIWLCWCPWVKNDFVMNCYTRCLPCAVCSCRTFILLWSFFVSKCWHSSSAKRSYNLHSECSQKTNLGSTSMYLWCMSQGFHENMFLFLTR